MVSVGSSALVAGSGRLLGGLAASAARALTRRVTFRWRVARRVRKRIDFSCRWGTYRKWLKTITAQELATPVEEIYGPLAKRLDDALCAASGDWASVDDHLSRSLRLVELTYPAIAAALGAADQADLTESWSQQRSASVRGLLLQLVGPGAALSSHDLGKVLLQRSEARRAVRLQVFQVNEAVLSSYFDQIRVPEVPVGRVVVLLGDFGSGKSETAETWHRAAIKYLVEGEDASFPVWLSARDLLGQTLEGAVESQVGPTWRQGRGASITVDGLDETDPAVAQALLEAARTLTRTYANVRILLTARPGILSPAPTEELSVASLIEEEALELVESAGGGSRATWRWTKDMRATVTRPFFALAAGLMLSRERAPRGEADLIRELVEDALAKGTERAAVTSGKKRAVLEKLAVALTRGRGDGLSFSDRQIARSSRLIAERANGSIVFSLPIFQHWFAAQALLAGEVPAEEVVADALSFNRWRWAAAVAALSAPGPERLDELLSTWVEGNPGAAAWVLNEAFRGQREWRTKGDEVLDAQTSGVRLLRALRAWTDALGPLSEGVLPFPVVQGPVGLGVTVSGHRIDVAFSTSRATKDYVTELPAGVHPLRPFAVPEWAPWFRGGPPEGDAWPWTMVRKMIAKATLEKLSNDAALGAPDGVWTQERRFDLGRRLLGHGSLFHGSLLADEVRTRAVEAFDAVEQNPKAQLSLGGSTTYLGGELQDLVTWIDDTGLVELVSRLPERDVSHPPSGWAWELYSPERLMEFEAEVYAGACEAFDEAMTHSFAQLGWSMPSSVLAPFGAILEISSHRGFGFGNVPSLTVVRVPMAMMPEIEPSGGEKVWSTSRRVLVIKSRSGPKGHNERHSATAEKIHSWLATQNREPIGGLGWTMTGADDMSSVRPASSVAAGWLWRDLKSIGLGTGTFPQLR